MVTVLLLIAATAALGGAAMLGWARVGFQVPLRGIVQVQVDGSQVLPVLGPLALLALAAVAAVLAIGGRARWLLGALFVVAAVPPALGAMRVTEAGRLAAAGLPARSVPAGPVTVLPAGPALAAAGAVLLAAAGVVLIVRGHRMPRLGKRYQVPSARSSGYPDTHLWERMDAGEDPTTLADPR